MHNLNRVELIGNLGSDPELRRSKSGEPVATFRVATTEKWTDRGTGEKREATEWHSVVVFGALADVAATLLQKGSKVWLEGRLQTSTFKGDDGMERKHTEICLPKFSGRMIVLDKIKEKTQVLDDEIPF